MSPSTLLQLYSALIVPQFDYGDIMYELYIQYNLDGLQKMQNQAARIISDSSHHTHRNDMDAEWNWLSLNNRCLMNICIMVYKCLNGMAPQYWSDKITWSVIIRSVKDLHVKNITLQIMPGVLKYISGTLTHNLPDYIKQQPSLTQFKNSVKRHLPAQWQL